MHGILDDVEAEVVGAAIANAGLHAAAGHPEGKRSAVVVAAISLAGYCSLAIHRAAELAAPDDERIFQAGRAASRSSTSAADAWSTSRASDEMLLGRSP